MAVAGWKQLIEDWPWFRGEGRFPVQPNSEFMPPVRLVLKPYGSRDIVPVADDDPWGWPITEWEEALTLRPGMQDLARHLLDRLVPLCRGDESHGIGQHKLTDNPYWPCELASRSRALEHERFVLLLPMALSMTQDDRAHVRWTLFGNSEQGPAWAFWKGFLTAPGVELPAEVAQDFFRTLLAKAYQEPAERVANLHRAGFRILPLGKSGTPSPEEGPLPSWTADFLVNDETPLRGVKYLLTFRPYRDLPAAVRRKYLAGDLNLLPFPGSLLFWGIDAYQRLAGQIRLAQQIPLLHMFERHELPGRIRVPQSGWFQEQGPTGSRPELLEHDRLPIRETYKRTFRNARAHRFDDCYVAAHEHRLAHTLFSTKAGDIGLYHKPMARNVQLWAHDFRPLLDGPSAREGDIRAAAEIVAAGGLFGYRLLFPAMCVGRHELFWHRPLVAYLDRKNRAALIDNAPLGYLTAYRQDESRFDQPVELWPRILQREGHADSVDLFRGLEEQPPRRTIINVGKILDAWERRGRQPLPRTFARQLLTLNKKGTLEGWLRWLPFQVKPRQRDRAGRLVDRLRACLEPRESTDLSLRVGTARMGSESVPLSRKKEVPPSLTFQHTACRSFEEAYWKTIQYLSAGAFINKNNADCIRDKPTHDALGHHHRDLEILGDHLLDYYARLAADHGMTDAVQIGELPFRWRTDYPFPWMGGWANNQDGKAYERNLMVRIPGRDRSRAVIMADHYDTAYMYDRFEKRCGGTGARLAAPGADDNCSATAALMLGAPAFFELSRQGWLDCDIWLIHLTGEEYPAEGQGACRMCQWLVEGSLALLTRGGGRHDLSGVRIQGVYVLDMIAHNNVKERDVFQIAPGASRESLWLAYQAHIANRAWNLATATWNQQLARRKAGRGRRCTDGKTIPPLSRFLPLYGEIRPHFDQRSTLFNTDGQAFSDAGIPVALFMENYDINRVGYHDTHDDMKMINLDYGAALAAITIESVARAATEEPVDS